MRELHADRSARRCARASRCSRSTARSSHAAQRSSSRAARQSRRAAARRRARRRARARRGARLRLWDLADADIEALERRGAPLEAVPMLRAGHRPPDREERWSPAPRSSRACGCSASRRSTGSGWRPRSTSRSWRCSRRADRARRSPPCPGRALEAASPSSTRRSTPPPAPAGADRARQPRPRAAAGDVGGGRAALRATSANGCSVPTAVIHAGDRRGLPRSRRRPARAAR